ncbi:MAG: FAD-linked oxidase C-terminal domain-containing protein, partial [Planctomycetaceae bacterium]
GAEGTLGIVTEATLMTVPQEAVIRVGLLFFESLELAAVAASRLIEFHPSACDIFDKRHLTLARAASHALEAIVPRSADACLLVEFSGDDAAGVNARLDAAIARIEAVDRLSMVVRRASDPDETSLYWSLARNVVPTLHRLIEGRPAVPWVEDVSLPPEQVPEFVARLPTVLRQTGLSAMFFGHAGHGELHLRPFANPRDAAESGSLERLADLLYEQVASIGGSIGAEQGLGLARTRAFGRLFPELSAVFGEIKAAFDPRGTLNPGRVTGGTPRPLMEARRPDFLPRVAGREALVWSERGVLPQLEACNGCGSCRGQTPNARRCPVFRAGQIEEASPRAKANLLSAVLSGSLVGKALETDAARGIADLCFNCHQCRRECDAAVDIPAIVAELKAAHVKACGLPLSRWVLSRIDLVSSLGGRFRGLANTLIANPQARWIMEKTLGIAQGRKLPPLAGGQFMRWAARRGLTRPQRHGGERVMVFLDTYARRHDPTLAQALVTILEHNGIGVFIDPRQVSSGMPMVAEGDVDAARRLARTNLRILSEAVRHGYRIISTEPSAVTCLTHDYPMLLDDEESQRSADSTSDATSYLWNLHREGRLRLDLEPISANLLYHAPCHTRVRGNSPAENLLGLIPGLSIQARDLGCSGMAGTFGLSREHYRTRLRIGLTLISAMRDPRIAAGVTECSGCRIQMEQGTTKPTVHPLKLLARSYRCLDGLDGILAASSGRLVTS